MLYAAYNMPNPTLYMHVIETHKIYNKNTSLNNQSRGWAGV